MRHRRKGRKLGRNPSHQRALLRSLASALFLTERDPDDLRFLKLESEPHIKGRIVTTLSKAKEVRPLVEKCITIASRSLAAQDEAAKYGTDASRPDPEYRSWRESDNYSKWNAAIAPAVTARRRCLRMLGDKNAVSVLFEEIAPRFVDRPGGYTRIVRLAQPRLGDAGVRAILELVGVHDRVTQRAERPAFDQATDDDTTIDQPEEASADASQDEDSPDASPPADKSAETAAGDASSTETAQDAKKDDS